jgi:hypothetical protein
VYVSSLSIVAFRVAGVFLIVSSPLQVCLYQCAYNFSVGPTAWVVAAEFPSNRLRSITFGFAMSFGFIFAWRESRRIFYLLPWISR